MSAKAKILIGGDFYPGGKAERTAMVNPSELIDPGILELFRNADLSLVNLECPLTRLGKEERIQKMGRHLKADPGTINFLNYLGIDAVTLANNHIFDYGAKGLEETLSLCKSNGIKTVGAGPALQEAVATLFMEINGIKIAIINIAENEWANASDTRGGANPMDIIGNVYQIREAKKQADFVFFIIHGGHELYHYPSPRMVRQYRFYAEQGASAVIGHHTHCISGTEVHKGVPIIYSTGNFFFPFDISFKGWYEGMLVSFEIENNNQLSWETIPYHQCDKGINIKRFNDNETAVLQSRTAKINAAIANPEQLQAAFDAFCTLKQKDLLPHLSTSAIFPGKFIRKVIRKTGMERLFLRKNQLTAMLNYFRCEAHRDIMLKIMNDYIRK